MANARRFLSLTPAERRRLVRAFLIVACVRIGLSLLPFPRFQVLLARFTTSSSTKYAAAPSTEKLAQDVRVVSPYVPRATCLTQALAGQVLLAQYGYPAVVHLGVTKEEGQGTFQAHAWMESDGKIVIGESEGAYVSLISGGKEAVL